VTQKTQLLLKLTVEGRWGDGLWGGGSRRSLDPTHSTIAYTALNQLMATFPLKAIWRVFWEAIFAAGLLTSHQITIPFCSTKKKRLKAMGAIADHENSKRWFLTIAVRVP